MKGADETLNSPKIEYVTWIRIWRMRPRKGFREENAEYKKSNAQQKNKTKEIDEEH